MTTHTAHRARLRLVAVLTTLLLLVGTGAAAAYWTARTQVSSNASAATVGLEQTMLPAAQTTPLATTYSAESSTAAGAVSIENTGSREATYTLTMRTGSATNPGLPGAIRVTAAEIVGHDECTPQKTLANVESGTLPFTFEGDIEAGSTIVVCVQTSLATGDISAFADEQIELEISSALAYDEAEKWMLDASAVAVAQNVEADPFGGVEQMTYGAALDTYLELSFSELPDDLQWKVEYRVFVAHEDTPSLRVPFRARHLSGYYTAVQVPYDSPDLVAFANSEDGGFGNTWVYVEQKLDGDQEWAPIAVGQMHIYEAAPGEIGELRLGYGWQ